jgi:hypothetical protein
MSNVLRLGQITLTELEAVVLRAMAIREPALRDTIRGLHVLSREFIGAGSFTRFAMDESAKDEDVAEIIVLKV